MLKYQITVLSYFLYIRNISECILGQNQFTSEIRFNEANNHPNLYLIIDTGREATYVLPTVAVAVHIFTIVARALCILHFVFLSFISPPLPLLARQLSGLNERKRERKVRRLNYAELLKYDNPWQIAWPQMNLYLR